MTDFLTLDNMILCPYSSNLLTDIQGVPLAPKLDHVLHLINKLHHFGLTLPHGRTLDYFMRQCFPVYAHNPVFALYIVQGEPSDKSTWSIVGPIGLCRVALDSYHAQLYIQQNYPAITREDSEPSYFIIPIEVL